MGRSGQLSRQHQRGRVRRGTVNRNPLRKVVGIVHTENGNVRELLECGHRVVPRQDFIGITDAARRRCSRCGVSDKEKS